MNFTPREKKLLLFAGILLISVAYIMFYFKPQLNTIQGLKDEISNSERNYSMNSAYKVKIGKMESELKILSQRIKTLREEFPPVLNYDEVLIELKGLSIEAKVNIDSILFSEIAAINVPGATDTAAANASTKASPAASSSISDSKLQQTLKSLGIKDGSATSSSTSVADGKGFIMSLKITASGTNNQIKQFVQKVETLKNKVVIKNMKISNTANGMLNINLTLDFYGIADSGVDNFSLLGNGIWNPLLRGNRTDMFSPYNGFIGSFEKVGENASIADGTTTEDAANLKNDFDITMLQYGNNLAPPTVTMRCDTLKKSVDTSLTPAIYGDNKGVEKAELVIEEKDGKFYCKYRTGQEAFPDINFKNMVEFKPVGNEIRMLILSTPRNTSGKDEAGLALNITNNSSKTLVVNVKGEDKNNPRVSINKQSEKIQLNFN